MSSKRPRSASGEPSKSSEKGSQAEREIEKPPFSQWSQREAQEFFEAYRAFGSEWPKVAQRVGNKSPQACEIFAKNFKSLLSLPAPLLTVTAFLAVVKDTLNIKEDGSEAHTASVAKSDETVTDTERETSSAIAPRRSGRTPKTKNVKEVGFDKSPVWGSRKPRRQSLRATTLTGYTDKDEDAEDALGVAALMSLASAAPDQCAGLREESNDFMAAHSFHREPSQSSDGINDFVSPRKRRSAGRARTANRRAPKKARSMNQDTDSEKPRRRKESKAALHGGDTEADEDQDNQLSTRVLRDVMGKGRKGTAESPARSASKRSRKKIASAEHTLLNAEDYDIQDYEGEAAVGYWKRDGTQVPVRKRRRKARPERAPQMMATASVIFARRNSLAFKAPPAAFLIGVPPASAQWWGIETEGQDSMGPVEVQLRHCLDPRVRRWCQAEFFCSVIDRPWFLQNELAEYLEHVGLPKGAKLARPALCIIRSSLGHPRRLSLSFLREERLKLEAWREHVRDTYKALGSGAELPSDIPPQLQVGHRVTARHPATRQLHDGDVLTVNHNSYRVQFLRRELGVELVRDVDVMPINPTECLPAALLWAHPHVVMNGRQAGRSREVVAGKWQEAAQRAADLTAGQPVVPGRVLPFPISMPPTKPGTSLQPRDGIRSVDDLKAAMDTKEALLARLKRMNDEVDSGMHKQQNGQRPPAFQRTYTQLLSDLHKLNVLLEASSFARPTLGPTSGSAAAIRPSLSNQPPFPLHGAPVPISPQRARSASMGRPGSATGAWDAIWKATQASLAQVKQTDPPSTSGKGQQQQIVPLRPGGDKNVPEAAGVDCDASPTPDTARSDGTPAAIQPQINGSMALPQNALDTRIAGCVSVLHTLHQCSERPQASAAVQKHTEKALALLRPKSKKNMETFNVIENRVFRLQAHLSKARTPADLAAVSVPPAEASHPALMS